MLISSSGIEDAEEEEPDKTVSKAEIDVNMDILMERSFKFKRGLVELTASHEEIFGRFS
jgi:hypothetical protein